MKDIIIEKKKEKAVYKFNDLFTSRKEIYKNGSTELPKTNYFVNELASILHPKSIHVTVTKIEEENETTKSFYLKSVDGSLPPFEAGSYVTLHTSIDGRVYKRPYSISSSPEETEEYRITIQKCENGLVSNYMYNNCTEDSKFTIEGPFGTFHYSSIRDTKEVIFLAGGSGITPIFSIIKEVLSKKKVDTATLLYGVRTEKDIIFKEELDELTQKYENLHVTYLLSEEKKEGYSHGVINEMELRKINPFGKSIFVCGPNAMYESLNEILKKLDIPNKYIRHEIYTNRNNSLYRVEHTLTVKSKDKTFTIPCHENETLLTSMERGQIDIPAHCTVGVCGFCRSKLIRGEVKAEISGLRKKDMELKYIHPCVTYPLSDVTIELPF